MHFLFGNSFFPDWNLAKIKPAKMSALNLPSGSSKSKRTLVLSGLTDGDASAANVRNMRRRVPVCASL
jgi:hypothetical protein